MRCFGQTWNNGASLDNGYTSHQYGPEVAVKFSSRRHDNCFALMDHYELG